MKNILPAPEMPSTPEQARMLLDETSQYVTRYGDTLPNMVSCPSVPLTELPEAVAAQFNNDGLTDTDQLEYDLHVSAYLGASEGNLANVMFTRYINRDAPDWRTQRANYHIIGNRTDSSIAYGLERHMTEQDYETMARVKLLGMKSLSDLHAYLLETRDRAEALQSAGQITGTLQVSANEATQITDLLRHRHTERAATRQSFFTKRLTQEALQRLIINIWDDSEQ